LEARIDEPHWIDPILRVVGRILTEVIPVVMDVKSYGTVKAVSAAWLGQQ